jgi:hypothetical protein
MNGSRGTQSKYPIKLKPNANYDDRTRWKVCGRHLNRVSEIEMEIVHVYHSRGISVRKERLHVGNIKRTKNCKRNERIGRSLVFEF